MMARRGHREIVNALDDRRAGGSAPLCGESEFR